MNFSNNAEMMGFEKAGWTRFFITPEKDGVTVILAGKPLKDNISDSDPLWYLRSTLIISYSGATDITIDNIENVSWNEYYNDLYKKFLM